MTKETAKKLDEKELLEILELAKLAERQAREMCEGITELAAKWEGRAEAKREKAQVQK